MVRDINMSYIEPLKPLWAQNPNGPAEGPHGPRLGAMGDPLKVNCATCHQGENRPLNGAPMLRDFPELKQVNQGPLRSADATPR
jgi:photosynthetic reaction center cytochrome c subunit